MVLVFGSAERDHHHRQQQLMNATPMNQIKIFLMTMTSQVPLPHMEIDHSELVVHQKERRVKMTTE